MTRAALTSVQALWWQAKGDWHQGHRCAQAQADQKHARFLLVLGCLAVVAIIALTLRFTQTPAPVTPGGSPTPSATAGASAVNGITAR